MSRRRSIGALLFVVGLLITTGARAQTTTPITNPGAWRVIYVSHEAALPASCVVVPSMIIVREGVDLGKVYACSVAGAPVHIGTLTTTGAGQANYSQSFASQTSVSLTHTLGTRNLIVRCYDASDQEVDPNTITIGGAAPYAVTVTFFVPQTGRCVVNGRS